MTAPSQEALAKLTPVLTKRWLSPDAFTMDTTSGWTVTPPCARRLPPTPTT